ncbi:ExbD/TolR family protein [Alkalilimnicola sp. S0819]|uniref:ExbD/TolR family protein n=1 Tax=Alkalilimnicola sp. S0819 TaxID=2613922 RepID=UPI0012622D4C|nr:biopolymer transporter ExbD [Alkalilimnicola sp. S0819]KAB7627651.1 biopolymer transporter ExbD [Alkalilimnicola sp. S0819]MPQ15817.1 biopolymer transporter ExbD [Alkalilimnicola sp. S0819]
MRLAAPQRREQEENLVPLINIVFLLLIFFMLAGTFTRPELFPVTPPESLSEAEAPEEALRLLLAADGRLALDGEELEDAQLRVRLGERLRVERPPIVQLKADGDIEAARLMAVMNLLRDSGVEDFRLLTVRGG